MCVCVCVLGRQLWKEKHTMQKRREKGKKRWFFYLNVLDIRSDSLFNWILDFDRSFEYVGSYFRHTNKVKCVFKECVESL